MTNEVNTARLVRVTATVPEICIHNVMLGPGSFCPQCPTASAEPSGELCPQCGAPVSWVPKEGDLLIEIETGEPCHVESIMPGGVSFYVKWETPEACYGTYNLRELHQGFARRSENRAGES